MGNDVQLDEADQIQRAENFTGVFDASMSGIDPFDKGPECLRIILRQLEVASSGFLEAIVERRVEKAVLGRLGECLLVDDELNSGRANGNGDDSFAEVGSTMAESIRVCARDCKTKRLYSLDGGFRNLCVALLTLGLGHRCWDVHFLPS